MKNKLAITLLAVVFAAGAAFAQHKELRAVDTFTKIAFRSHGKLYLRQGSPQKVEIEGSQATLDKINTEVKDGRLIIETDRKWSNRNWRSDDDFKVYVTVANLDAISVSGSGDLIAETKITGGDFKITVSGSGSMQAEIDATGELDAGVSGSGNLALKGKFKSVDSDVSGSGDMKLDVIIAGNASFGLSGSGNVTAQGSAKELKATISGSGQVRAADFDTETCDVRISGSGDVQVSVSNSLDASISGSGTVSYKGNPSHVNSHASGSGHVRKM